MDDATLRNQIGSNIAAYRKQAGLTQAGLAEKLNYSDKAVSKWERGESVPDVMTLVQLAELFRIPVGELLADPDALPGNPGTLEKAMTQVSEKALKRKANKNVILALSSTLVWFIALFVFVIMSSFHAVERYSWLAFFYAVPVNAIVMLSLLSAWHDLRHRVGIPDRHSCFRAADFPVQFLENLPSGHSGADRHFPVVPDVPPGERESGGYGQWIRQSCAAGFGRKNGR